MMKIFLQKMLMLSLLLTASSAFAWFGGNNGNNWGPWNNNGGNGTPWNNAPWNNGGWNNGGGNNGWQGNPYDEWDPRYWAEEMEDFFDGGNNYSPYNYGRYNGGPQNYAPYGYGNGNGPYGPPSGYYRPYSGQHPAQYSGQNMPPQQQNQQHQQVPVSPNNPSQPGPASEAPTN